MASKIACFKDLDEYFAFRLTVGHGLYKHMRIYLLTVVCQEVEVM
jgi:hypothetical protein